MDVSWWVPLVGSAARVTDVVGAWLLTYTVHSTVLLLAAWGLATRSWLRGSPAAQHAIWRAAMVAGFVTATAQVASPWLPLGGTWQLAAPRHEFATVRLIEHEGELGVPPLERVTEPLGLLPSLPPLSSVVIRRIASSTPAAVGGASSLGLPRGPISTTEMTVVAFSSAWFAVLAWALIAMLLLAHQGMSRRRLRQRLAERRDAASSLAGGALRHLRARAGIREDVRLTTSNAVPAPAALAGNEIVLPLRALHELPLAEQEAVLAHELAHVVRGDTRALRLATCIERLAWFQPLNHLARRQMQHAAEFAADAWSVRITRQPLSLAQALARVATWLVAGEASPATVVPGADGSPLVERVRRLTSGAPAHEMVGHRGAASVVAVVALAALVTLPRVDLGKGATALHNAERLELRLARGAEQARARRGPGDSLHVAIQLVRVEDGRLQLTPGGGRDSIGVGRRATRVLVFSQRAAS